MRFESLREEVCRANRELDVRGLVIFSWGNVSGIDREAGVVVIKPSGVSYDSLLPEDLVAVDLEGTIVEGTMKPSSDTATHLELYKAFEGIGGVCHTHSRHATMWAQAKSEIPCFGTTHADYFYGAVPVTREMRDDEIQTDYELNTGRVIVERFEGLDANQMPAVLVASHGPFTWGVDAGKAVENAVVLEEVAMIGLGTRSLAAGIGGIDQVLLDKHYLRKHGAGAYYGQTARPQRDLG